MNLHSYPKVYAIGHAAVTELFDGPVLIEEKIDGSQFSFGLVDGQVQMRSHGAEIHAVDGGASEKMFNAAVQTVQELAPILHDGWIYRAEFLSKPKHNNLCYERVPLKHLILFDINIGNDQYLSRFEKEQEANRIGLEIVPALFLGVVLGLDQITALLDRESCLGKVKPEGFVVKNYDRFGRDGKVLMGKFVSEAYKETASKNWKLTNPTHAEVIDLLGATLRSERRWEKAIERLRDEGQLKHEPADIGPLIKTIQQDIAAEEQEFIVQRLLEFAMPKIMRAATAGFPEFYKRKLLESAFPVDTSDSKA
jgi:hypothetical protein